MKKIIFVLAMLFSSMSFADVVKSFSIEGDTWVIKTFLLDEALILCKMEGGSCVSAGIGVYWDFYDIERNGSMSARDYYRMFLDKAQSKVVEYYFSASVPPPEEGDFIAFLEYLIKNGTTYNEIDQSFSITK